jgi:hypothetical protein
MMIILYFSWLDLWAIRQHLPLCKLGFCFCTTITLQKKKKNEIDCEILACQFSSHQVFE